MSKPNKNDYVKLYGDNFTTVVSVIAKLDYNKFIIRDPDGVDFLVNRNKSLDTNLLQGWEAFLI